MIAAVLDSRVVPIALWICILCIKKNLPRDIHQDARLKWQIEVLTWSFRQYIYFWCLWLGFSRAQITHQIKVANRSTNLERPVAVWAWRGRMAVARMMARCRVACSWLWSFAIFYFFAGLQCYILTFVLCFAKRKKTCGHACVIYNILLLIIALARRAGHTLQRIDRSPTLSSHAPSLSRPSFALGFRVYTAEHRRARSH